MFNLFGSRTKKYQDIGAEAFKKGMSSPDAVLIDVRSPGEFSAEKIKGARNIDLFSPSFQQQVANLPKDKEYYLYCRSGNRSGQACSVMANMGFEKLYNLQGGIISWPY